MQGHGYTVAGIHETADPIDALHTAAALFVGGGNTFVLLRALHEQRLIAPMRKRVEDGLPYMGSSAGSNIAGLSLGTTNDMPIVQPVSFETLGLVDFQINPHYFTGQVLLRDGDDLQEHFGETRDDRIREYHELNERPVIGLWEGTHLLVTDGHAELFGGPARVFRPGAEPLDVSPADDLDAALHP